jgi:hypothetical protein
LNPVNTRSLSVQCLRLTLASLLANFVLVGNSPCAEEPVIPRERHPWAAFRPGSWKLVKVTTETFDKDGKSIGESVTETRTMLLSVDAASYELQIDVTVDVAGKRFPSQSRVTRQGFHGESGGQQATIRHLAPAAIKVAGRTLTAQTAEIEITNKDSRKVTQLHYAAGIQPYVLARRSITFDASGKVLQEAEVETQAVQILRTILGMRRSTWETRTTQKHSAGSVVTDEIHCFDIPGGVVEHTSEELDDKGVVRRRSRLELVNYGIAMADKPLRRRDTPRHTPRKPRR